MGKHTVLEIFSKRHSSAGAVLKGTAGHNMWAKGKWTINHGLAPGWRHTSHYLPPMKAPVWRKNSSSTSCWNISSLDCRFGWERLSFSDGTLSLCKAGDAPPGTSLSNALRMGKRSMLEIFVLLRECSILKGILRTGGCAFFLLDLKSRKAQKSDGCLLSHHPIYGIEIKQPFVRKTCDTTQLALAAERYSWGS